MGTLFLGNHEGHIGMLCLPVPNRHIQAVQPVLRTWEQSCEVPLVWAGREWRTADDFLSLRDAAFNMPDIFLLGIDTQMAMALTPDWSWEQYPLGLGLPAVPKADRSADAVPAAVEIPFSSNAALSAPPSRRSSRHGSGTSERTKQSGSAAAAAASVAASAASSPAREGVIPLRVSRDSLPAVEAYS